MSLLLDSGGETPTKSKSDTPMDRDDTSSWHTSSSHACSPQASLFSSTSASSSQSIIQLNTCVHPFFIEVLKDKQTVCYQGRGSNAPDIGCVRADSPAPTDNDVFYFEVLILEASYDGAVTIGLATDEFDLARQPGSFANSYGYRGDAGCKFSTANNKRGCEYGPKFGTDDVVGCGLNLAANEIFFTLNGVFLGVAFTGVDLTRDLFAVVGLHASQQIAMVNFGRRPFRFDLPLYASQQQHAIADAIDQVSIDERSLLPSIQDYLIHNGYGASLQAFNRVTDLSPPDSEQSRVAIAAIPARRKIYDLIVGGQLEEAMGLLRHLFPGVLQHRSELQCRLSVLQFIAALQDGREADAIVFAQQVLSTFNGLSPDTDRLVKDAVALLAYPDMQQSPVQHLLSLSHRHATASAVNAAILESQSLSRCSRLEMLLRQLGAVHSRLRRDRVHLGQPFSFPGIDA